MSIDILLPDFSVIASQTPSVCHHHFQISPTDHPAAFQCHQSPLAPDHYHPLSQYLCGQWDFINKVCFKNPIFFSCTDEDLCSLLDAAFCLFPHFGLSSGG